MTPRRITRSSLLIALLLPGLTLAALNDTGITQCANDKQNNLTCPQVGFPSQDAEVGRDAQQTAGTLTKVGGGSAGFDFTKLDSGGNPLPASAPAWDCVRDNVTGLIWEIKTDDNGLRDQDWTYTWYNSDPATNGGNAGVQGSDTCGGTLPGNQCNTQAYVVAVNALSPALCGYADWRMPTVDELHNIVDHSGSNPAIGAAYFPRTVSDWYWSASPYAPVAGDAWYVRFDNGFDNFQDKGNAKYVRLVRGGPSLALETTPTSDFITLDDVNGTAYHQKTGLTWKRCAEGQSWDSVNKTCTGTAASHRWSAALSLVGGGWRLPNINELRSIIERRNWNPAINTTVFPSAPGAFFWSASPCFWSAAPCVPNAGYVWDVGFYYGNDLAHDAGNNYAVRLVRDGPWISDLGPGRVATSGGASFSVLNNVSGTIAYATGLNADGQLGAGPLTEPSATRPQAFAFRRIYPVRVYWSARRTGRSPTATVPLAATDTPNFITLASATAHTVALRDDGSVWAWGGNANGQLGNGTTTDSDQPVPVLSDSSGTPLSGVVAIAAGRDHSVAVKNDGTVWTWGNNAHGQLGDNSDATTTRLYPVQVLAGAAPLTGVRQVAASDVHTVALKTDGTVWAWGGGGSLGTGDTTPQRTAVQIPGLTAVQAILARGTETSARTLAQRSDGLWGWGDNGQCQLGDPATVLGNTTTPARLTNLSALGVGLNALAQGDFHGLARKADGTVWGWGGNGQGQVGDGTTTTQCAPIQVAGLSNVETIGAGVDHSLVTLRNGTVFGWGNNDRGQLGVGDTTPRATPTAMKGEDNTGTLDLKPDSTTLPGDVTGDGVVNALDVVAVINAVLGIQPLPAADVNNDGAVNALDVVFVINEVLGL